MRRVDFLYSLMSLSDINAPTGLDKQIPLRYHASTMVTIRLSRTGKRHAPQYRIVVQQKQTDPWSPAIEVLGTYNPRTNPSTINLKEDRIKEWIANGAQPSETVHNLFVNAGLIEGKKKKAVTISNKRKAKMSEKAAAAEEAKAAKKVADAEKVASEEAKEEEVKPEETPAADGDNTEKTEESEA